MTEYSAAGTRPAGTRRVVIEPVTRVEGHGKVTIHLDRENRVREARLHIVEFRGFERFIQGRPFWEMPVAVQRLCGICPVSHHLCAAKAVDRIVGGEQLTPTAEKMRRLMHFGQFFQSHALHFFHLASPDLLFGFEADPLQRNVLGVAAKHPDLARQGILMRKYGQEIIRATAGKKIHGTGAIPGGINKNLSLAERDELLADHDRMVAWARAGVALARDYTLEHLSDLADFGSFESNFLALVRADGALELYDGGLRAIDADGRTIFDHVDNQTYLERIAEEVRPWSYMKFPFIRSLGTEKGWYRVGPLARVNACDFIDTPLAEQARLEFKALGGGRPVHVSMAYHWARMIETLHAIEKIGELLHDPDLQGTDLVVAGTRRPEGVGIIEAPRGTLFHHYRVGADDLVTLCNLIVSTTSNNEPMNRAVTRVAERAMNGRAVITEGMMNQVEVVIRAYDPCLSCATHAMGRMPLVLEVFNESGRLLDRRIKAGQPVRTAGGA
jgi:NAD-reducing hydrogenase large subunit